MINDELLMTISRDDYFRARNALDKLVRERAAILPSGLEGLRQWLGAGAGERWLQHEDVVQQARVEDLATTMWWEYEWRRERKRQQRIEEQRARRPAPPPTVEHTQETVGGNTKIAAPLKKSQPGAGQRPVSTPARSFSPTGSVWRA